MYNPSKLCFALVLFMPVPTGIAVMASWSTLALNRRRRPEPTWLDRLGRGIGYIWLLLMLVGAGHFSVFLGIAIE